MKKLNIKKPDFSSISFKGGAYTTIFSVIAVIAVVAINLIFGKLNITFDLTDNGMFSITDETKDYLAGIEDDITIYYLEPNGESIDIFTKILGQIDKASKHVEVVVKDPVLYPSFAKDYTASEDVNYGIIVVNERTGKSRFMAEEDYVILDYSMDYTTYQLQTQTTGLDLEGKIDSAIGYVLSDETAKIYQVTGHGEEAIGSETVKLINKANLEVDSLKLMMIDEIPDDCSVLFIQNPQNDLTEEEAELLRDYLSKGGKLIVNLSYKSWDHLQLLGVLGEYGITIGDGIIFDRENRMNKNYPAYCFVANVTANDINEGIYNKKYIISQGSSEIITNTDPENLSLDSLLYTSDTAYIKRNKSGTTEKEAGDKEGTFYFGSVITDSVTGAQIAAFSGLGLFDDRFANVSSYGNIDLLLNTVNALADIKESTLAVRAIDFTQVESLIIPDASTAIGLAVVLALVPVVLLITGIIVVVVRRKKS